MRRGSAPGFTVMELMVSMAIVSALGALSVRYIERGLRLARATEATVGLARIYEGEYTYFMASSERATPPGFVAAPPTPAAAPARSRYPADPETWRSSPAWQALGFVLDRPHYFQYAVTVTADGRRFTAHAGADLDGDGLRSHFTRGAVIDGEGEFASVATPSELEDE